MGTARPLSIMQARDPEVLQVLLDFYVRPQGSILDVTANARRMWKGVRWGGNCVFCDVDPEQKPDVVCDFRSLPFPDGSAAAIVFDPPHLPAAAASPRSNKGFAGLYGLALSPKQGGPESLWLPFLQEAVRVLEPDGVILAKLSDYVHNHKYHWSLARFVAIAERMDGLTPCDLLVKQDPCTGNLKSGRWQRAYHARRAHCWWIIVRKGRCEPRKRLSGLGGARG